MHLESASHLLAEMSTEPRDQGICAFMRIILCDDQTVIRKRLEMLLRLQADIEVVGSAENGAEAVRMAEQLQPDLVLMDLKMPGMNGI
ncbi:MAG: hypothetical protein DCC55_15775 [Chloroflexi bacterium]|nr:MAG: hypothetical protein DCC55_15775 [Chloroflexota bacterium]